MFWQFSLLAKKKKVVYEARSSVSKHG